MTDIIKVGIVGARVRDSVKDKSIIKDILVYRMKKGDKLHLVSGGCRKGADRFAEELAIELGLPISIHPPLISGLIEPIPRWQYAQACYDRNTLIAQECDLLIALPRYKEGYAIGGTADTIKKVEALKKPVVIL